MQNNVLSTRISSLYGLQPSPVALCIQNRDLRPELQHYVGRRPHLWICACKTECLPLELLVSNCPRTHLWICACKTACLPLELLVSMGPRPHLWICANKTAFLAPKFQVSMGPSPHLWFCAFKTATLPSE